MTSNPRPSNRLARHAWTALLAFLIAGCSLFGGDKPEDPPADLVKFKSSLRIKKVWSSGVGDDAENLRLALAPASDGSRIYAGGHDGRVVAFDAVKGGTLWKTKTDLPLSAGPSVGESAVVLGSSDGDVIALDASDGHELWRTSVSSEVLASPVVTPSLVLVRTVDGRLVALSIEDGSEIWFVQQSVPRLSVRGTGSPVISRRVVVCGFDNGKLAAYELGNGALIWEVMVAPPSGRTEVDRLSDLNATVTVIGDDIYAVGYQSTLSAVAIESGQVLWSREISSHTGIGVDMNNLYVSGDSGNLIAIDRSGQELWRKDTLLHRDVTGPTGFGSSVVVGDLDGYLHWFDSATGDLQARVRAGSDRVMAPPLVVNEMIYVLTDGGKLYAFKDVTKPKKNQDENKQANGFYIGAGLGYGHVEKNAGAKFGVKGEAMTFKGLVGYRLRYSPKGINVAIEGAYIDMGNVHDENQYLPQVNQLKFDGYDLSGIAFFPIAHRWDIMAKAGAYFWESEHKGWDPAASASFNSNESGTDLSLGFGASYNTGTALGFRAEVESLGVLDGAWTLTVSGIYQFK